MCWRQYITLEQCQGQWVEFRSMFYGAYDSKGLDSVTQELPSSSVFLLVILFNMAAGENHHYSFYQETCV